MFFTFIFLFWERWIYKNRLSFFLPLINYIILLGCANQWHGTPNLSSLGINPSGACLHRLLLEVGGCHVARTSSALRSPWSAEGSRAAETGCAGAMVCGFSGQRLVGVSSVALPALSVQLRVRAWVWLKGARAEGPCGWLLAGPHGLCLHLGARACRGGEI